MRKTSGTCERQIDPRRTAPQAVGQRQSHNPRVATERLPAREPSDHGAELVRALHTFSNGAVEVDRAWEGLDHDEPEALTTYYPFHRDFRELTHEIMEWTGQTEAAFMLRDPAVLTGLHSRRFTLDGEPIDTREFLSANDFDPATLLDLWKLQPGEEYQFGGGAAARFVLRREDGAGAEHLPAPRRRLAAVERLPARRVEPAGQDLELSVRLAYLNEDLHPRSFTFGRPPWWNRATQARAEEMVRAEVEGWAPLAAPLAVGYLTESFDHYPTGTVAVRADTHWNDDSRIWLVNRYDRELREWLPLVWDEKRAQEGYREHLPSRRRTGPDVRAERCPTPASVGPGGSVERCPSPLQRATGASCTCKRHGDHERCPAQQVTRQRR